MIEEVDAMFTPLVVSALQGMAFAESPWAMPSRPVKAVAARHGLVRPRGIDHGVLS